MLPHFEASKYAEIEMLDEKVIEVIEERQGQGWDGDEEGDGEKRGSEERLMQMVEREKRRRKRKRKRKKKLPSLPIFECFRHYCVSFSVHIFLYPNCGILFEQLIR